ncbi:hypothetical protein J1N35_002363 [Gossypium stocksii]|uniref:Uncharacterized protein n=1 Tax=Gossypium stocksii TaxID=47602 RepID=A0A9D3WLL3_9ROSI|nr:hypothetical protein J1N35_002363 [Gossypium stocksii]
MGMDLLLGHKASASSAATSSNSSSLVSQCSASTVEECLVGADHSDHVFLVELEPSLRYVPSLRVTDASKNKKNTPNAICDETNKRSPYKSYIEDPNHSEKA